MENQTRIIKLRDLSPRIGYSRAAIYSKLDPKSPQFDPEMPRPISLGGRAVGWIEAEVEAWLQSRIAARDANLLKGGRHA